MMRKTMHPIGSDVVTDQKMKKVATFDIDGDNEVPTWYHSYAY